MKRCRAGFTLVEVTVVLLLLSLMAAVAAPAFSALRHRRAIDDAASAVTRVLERTRSRALAHGVVMTLVIDPATMRVWQERPDTTFVLSLPDECTMSAESLRARITFRADGTAAGETLTVKCGADAVAISADALNGAVRALGGR